LKRPTSRGPQSRKPAARQQPARSVKVTKRSIKATGRAARKPRATNALFARIFSRSKVAANRVKIDRDTIVRFKARPKQTKAIVLTALGSLVALIVLVLATIFTPLLAVENIKITGLQKIDEKKVAAAVKSQIGIPLALVTQQSVADQLSRFTLIESFSLVSELPHTLHIAISERQPICIVDVGGVSYLYDPAGVRLGQASYKDTYPRVLIKGEPKTSASYSEAIDVLLALPAKLLPRISVIDAKSKDDVTMQLRGYAGQKIIWGDASQAALKSKVLAALIANQKQTDRVTFDVSSPTAPVVRYR
jgi:cell division protein FtsQ